MPLNAKHLRLALFPMYRRVTAGFSQIQFATAELTRESPNVTVSPGRDKHQLIRNSTLARANKPAKVFPSPGPEWNVNVPPPLILILISTQGALPGGPAKDLFDAFEIFCRICLASLFSSCLVAFTVLIAEGTRRKEPRCFAAFGGDRWESGFVFF